MQVQPYLALAHHHSVDLKIPAACVDKVEKNQLESPVTVRPYPMLPTQISSNTGQGNRCVRGDTNKSVIFLSIVYHLFDAIFIQAPKQGHMGSNFRHIDMSEITPFRKLPMFSDIVKSLYIPASDPSWQQLVHAVVLLAATRLSVGRWTAPPSGVVLLRLLHRRTSD